MINNWQIPRNKRKLYPVVDVLSLFNLQIIGDVWGQNLDRQLDFEAELERYGIKRAGARRDQRAGGARTYEAWLFNLGLIFNESGTNKARTTLAGEALLDGSPPVPIITNQLMKLQYPSAYSVRKRVDIHSRFQIRPFRFLIKLLADERIQTLSKEEIGRFVITEGANETIACFENVVQRILDYRIYGDSILPNDFEEIYASSTNGVRSRAKTLSGLEDIANTFINYLEYTQLINRDSDRKIYIPVEKRGEVANIINDGKTLRVLNVGHSFGLENFQRSFGLAPNQNRDNRNFGGQVITEGLYRKRRVRSEFLHIAGIRPITNIDSSLISELSSTTGYTISQIEEAVEGFRPDSFSLFESSYLNMAISGTELATEFEIATKDIFKELGFASTHVGHSPLHPDIFVQSPLNYSGIIDTKAYRSYSINNDHRNRMINNYIPTYQTQHKNFEFFMYVADGFGSNIDSQLQKISQSTNVKGSVITAQNLIRILQRNNTKPVDHNSLRGLFMRDSVISLTDIDTL